MPLDLSLHHGITGWRVGQMSVLICKRHDKAGGWVIRSNEEWAHRNNVDTMRFRTRKEAHRTVVALILADPDPPKSLMYPPVRLIKRDAKTWETHDGRWRVSGTRKSGYTICERGSNGEFQAVQGIMPTLRYAASIISSRN